MIKLRGKASVAIMPKLSNEEFENLYTKNRVIVRNYVMGFIKSSIPLFTYEECGDLINEIFLTVHEAWEKFDGRCSETTYVIAVAKRYLSNERRKRIRRKEIEEDAAKQRMLEPEEGEEIDKEKLTIIRERQAILKEVIEELEKKDEKLAYVIKLYRQDFTDKEIGERLNTPGKTIFHWRNKALEILKELLKKRGFESLEELID